jgi:hypothetical protein
MVKQKGSEQGGIDEPVDVPSGVSSGDKYRPGRFPKRGRTLKVRLNERDSTTRGEDRVRVTMEPAFKSIINVYQLVQKKKLKKGTSPVYTTTDKARAAVIGGIPSGVSGSGRSQPAPQKLRKSYAPGWEAYFVDTNNDLVLTEEQKKKVKDYAKLNKEHKEKERPIREQMRMDRDAEIAAKNAGIEAANVEAIQKSQSSRAAGAGPKEELIRRIRTLKIPLTTNARTWEKNTSYRDGIAITSETIDTINKAIDNAVAEDRLTEVPPPIIILTDRMNSPQAATTVYIKKDLRNFRRKKLLRMKAKRSAQRGNVKKIAPGHGKGKRVVMKKKGGKR